MLCFFVLLGSHNSVLNFVQDKPKNSSHIKNTFLYSNCLSDLSRQAIQMHEAKNKRWLRRVGSRAIAKSHAENPRPHIFEKFAVICGLFNLNVLECLLKSRACWSLASRPTTSTECNCSQFPVLPAAPVIFHCPHKWGQPQKSQEKASKGNQQPFLVSRAETVGMEYDRENNSSKNPLRHLHYVFTVPWIRDKLSPLPGIPVNGKEAKNVMPCPLSFL